MKKLSVEKPATSEEVPMLEDEMSVSDYLLRCNASSTSIPISSKYSSTELVCDALRSLKLFAMAEALIQQTISPDYYSMPFVLRLGKLVEQQVDKRNSSAVNRLFAVAGLPRGEYTIDKYLDRPDRGILKSALREYLECQWLPTGKLVRGKDQRSGGKSICITGATGTGKTYLGCMLTAAAMEHGHSARYISIHALGDEMEAIKRKLLSRNANVVPSKTKVIAELNKADLLTIDNFGIGEIPTESATALYYLLQNRSHLSTIVISQQPINESYNWIPNVYSSESIIDRIINFKYQINMEGESLRETFTG